MISNLQRTETTPKPTARRFWIVMGATFVTTLLYFLYAWWLSPARPGRVSTGWSGYYDQSQYLAIARDLAAGHLPSRQGYVYGLAYPLVAAPFLKLGLTTEPFVIPNAVAFAATITMVAVVGARLRSLSFGLLCAAAVTLATPLLDLTIIPWSSTLTLVTVTAVLVVVTAPRLAWPGAVVVGLAVGTCFAARYVDAAFPAMIGGAGILMSAGRRFRLLAIAALTAVAIIAPVLLTHWLVLGHPWTTPYASHLAPGNVGPSDQDVSSFDLTKVIERTIGGFLTARVNGQRVPGQPLVVLFPWAIIAPVGLWILLTERHSLRRVLAAAFATSVVGTVFYMSFRASGAGNLQFGFLHYFKVWFVVWGILAAYGVARLLDRLNGSRASIESHETFG
jgi:hypothetical protein